ncbi:MAG: DNA-directed RNA polymerase subunit alpha [Opitutales bacterium]|nr:DNA-directed RNA polymerase subunit alpha [Opitutales bacterium]
MPKRLASFQLPKSLNTEGTTDTYGKFVAEPFEKGYGQTLGTALRRVLISSIEGAAITSVAIEGVQHEFQTIEDVKEDVVEIVLNLKKIIIKAADSTKTYKISLDTDKEGEIKASDIRLDAGLEIVNPDQLICTLNKKRPFHAEFTVKTGRAWCRAEDNKSDEQSIGEIAIDSLFSPVTRVNISVEDTRHGQKMDYEKLVLEIWTDGRITPAEALADATAILRKHLAVFDEVSSEPREIRDADARETSNNEEAKLQKVLNMSVNEIELSVRAANCLNNANITTVGELAQKTEADMLKYRNFGKKSLTEIKECLAKMGVTLGMDFDKKLLDQDRIKKLHEDLEARGPITIEGEE